jgi:hypothetical protein
MTLYVTKHDATHTFRVERRYSLTRFLMWALVEGQWSVVSFTPWALYLREISPLGRGLGWTRAGLATLLKSSIPYRESRSCHPTYILGTVLTYVSSPEKLQGLRDRAEFIQFWFMPAGYFVTSAVRKVRMERKKKSIDLKWHIT